MNGAYKNDADEWMTEYRLVQMNTDEYRKTVSNLVQPIQTCSSLFKLDKIDWNWLLMVSTCSNWNKVVQTESNLFKPDKLVKTGSN